MSRVKSLFQNDDYMNFSLPVNTFKVSISHLFPESLARLINQKISVRNCLRTTENLLMRKYEKLICW